MTDILKLLNVSKSFGPAQIIRNLSLNIKKGERHAIIGPNAAVYNDRWLKQYATALLKKQWGENHKNEQNHTKIQN